MELPRRQIVIASSNAHKIVEIGAIVGAFGYDVVSRRDAGVPEDFDVEETGKTFEENSFLKAKAIFDLLGGGSAALADDSGLCVDALGGAPGVYSARFADTDADLAAADAKASERGGHSRQDFANNLKLLDIMAKDGGVPREKRTARFVSVITLILPPDSSGSGDAAEPRVIVCRGEVEGHIDFRETGEGGFGYDPLFLPTDEELKKGGLLRYSGKSFGTFPAEDKNKISHRFRALEKLSAELGTLK